MSTDYSERTYKTIYIQKKMGFGLTTHPIYTHIYENLYAI